MATRACRLWWPKPLLLYSDLDLLLFGWFFAAHSASLDVVVAAGICPSKLPPSLLAEDLEKVLQLANEELPTSLLKWSKLSVVGSFTSDFTSNGSNCLEIRCNKRISTCGCFEMDKIAESHRQCSVGSGNWIQLFSTNQSSLKKNLGTLKLHHVHENGKVDSIYHLHVVQYDPPQFGRHHFSLNCWNSSMQEHGRPLRAPNWFSELQKRHSAMNMGTIILSINCSSAVERLLTIHLKPLSPSRPDETRFNTLLGNLATTFVASTSTLVYMAIQVFHSFVNKRSKPLLCTLVASIFQHTWLNVNIRSSQFLYWPVILQGSGSRLNYNVEYMHKVALRKHAVWSNITFDVILAFISGLLLLMNRQMIYCRIPAISGQITNDLLRSGCVWLMGVPAGFKLNTELAEMFGLISLNVIQIWSTLWFFMGSALPYAVIVLTFSGMFLGLTVLVALCMDMLKIATVHISILHWFISFIYSLQILAVSSLWRLFRGQKWNPLRKRLDSFDYTVEEHVVGALLFTPILLLLPTTSVFYMFFTMANSFISLTCILIEIMISLLHATPHAEIFLWMLKKGRFPSGIWFETLPICSSMSAATPINGSSDSNLSLLDKNLKCPLEISTLVSVLHTNHATIGQILRPKIREVFNGVSMSLSSFFGILSGQSIPSTTRTGVPPAMPWMNLSYHDYWRLCRESILEHVFYST